MQKILEALIRLILKALFPELLEIALSVPVNGVRPQLGLAVSRGQTPL